MVQISDEEFTRRHQARVARPPDGLTEFDREMLGRAVRIELPVNDAAVLAQAADLLRGLANQIDFCLQRQDIPLRPRLQMIKDYAWNLNRRLRDEHQRRAARD